MHWAVENYMPFWTKEKAGRGLGFQEKVGKSHVDKKEQT